MHHIDDVKALYYSCILYEQKKECRDSSLKKYITFWEKEVEDGTAFSAFISDVGSISFSCSEMFLSVTCSTVCNAKCSNCVHDKMVKCGDLIPKIVELDEIYYRIRKVKLLTELYHIRVDAVDPNGMGEPLTHPNIVDVLKYLRIFFPNVRIGINTNASLLRGELARQIAKLNLDHTYLSLSYFNQKVYENEIGLNYNSTMKNILNYLQIRDEEKAKTMLIIHVFNNSLNSKDDIKNFIAKFQPLLRETDVLEVRRYLEYVKNDLKKRGCKRKNMHPCFEIWNTMTVDAEGNIFPCCLGLWKKYDSYLSIGNIAESIPSIVKNLINLRSRQIKGDLGSCASCIALTENESFMLPMVCYNKEKSVCGDIQYATENMLFRRMMEIGEKVIKARQLTNNGAYIYHGCKEKL